MSAAITVFHALALVCLVAAAFLTLFRMAKGPSSLDRSIASDVMISTFIGGTGLFMVVTHLRTALPVLVVLSILGFTAAVSIARLISNRSAQVCELADRGMLPARESGDHTGMQPVIREIPDHDKRDTAPDSEECAPVAPIVSEESWDDEDESLDAPLGSSSAGVGLVVGVRGGQSAASAEITDAAAQHEGER